MILINSTKYSCLECIRGHRSSLCRHHMRPLLQVRSKGRPNDALSTGNKNHRIAVFAEEIDMSPEPESGSCKKLPVVILKASNKHIIDLSSGQIVGPYNEEEHTNAQRPMVKPDSFVYSASCCSDGVSKARKVCGCSQKKVSKSKILKAYLCKKRKEREMSGHDELLYLGGGKTLAREKPHSCCSKRKEEEQKAEQKQLQKQQEELQKQLQHPQIDHYRSDHAKRELSYTNGFSDSGHSEYSLSDSSSGMLMSESGKEVFEVINVPACSIPGSCSCSSNCKCPNCEVHNGSANTGNGAVPSLDFLNDSEFGSNLILTQAQSEFLFVPMTLLAFSAPHSGALDSQQVPGQLATAQLISPQQTPIDAQAVGPDISALAANSTNSAPKPEPHCASTNSTTLLDSAIFNSQSVLPHFGANETDYVTYLQLLLTSPSPQGDAPDNLCTCSDDSCFCQNCEKHGIIEGYRLDDVFAKVPLDFLAKTEGVE